MNSSIQLLYYISIVVKYVLHKVGHLPRGIPQGPGVLPLSRKSKSYLRARGNVRATWERATLKDNANNVRNIRSCVTMVDAILENLPYFFLSFLFSLTLVRLHDLSSFCNFKRRRSIYSSFFFNIIFSFLPLPPPSPSPLHLLLLLFFFFSCNFFLQSGMGVNFARASSSASFDQIDLNVRLNKLILLIHLIWKDLI